MFVVLRIKGLAAITVDKVTLLGNNEALIY
jgi:hypothetical protein